LKRLGWLPALLLPVALQAQRIPAFVPVPADGRPESAEETPLMQKVWVRPVASLIVPGTGQLLAGQARGVVYLALEIWIASRAIATNQQGGDQAARYRQLAYDVARKQYSATRVDGPFEYYESMEKFVESGEYDTDSIGPAFVPEPDPTTYNGSVWALARRTFFQDPDSIPDPASPAYQQAVAFYQSRAVGGQFRWSWRNARLEQDVFRGAIRTSDDAYRQRTNYLGVLVLNHLASAIDALISAKKGQRSPAVPQVRFQANPEAAALVWTGRF
jgi:hypothetical protein